jgi:hypothetical protein
MVVHASNPSYLGDRDRSMAVRGQPGKKKVNETLSKNKASMK